MIKNFGLLFLVLTTLLLTGCHRVFIDVSPSQSMYLYKKDISKSDRYNAGSNYVWQWPLEVRYKSLFIDYGIQESKFESTYVIESGTTRLNIPVKATIQHRLIRNPQDNGKLSYKDDKHVQFFTQVVASQTYNSETIYRRLLREKEDIIFRNAFRKTDQKGNLVYDTFDKVEISIPRIREEVSAELSKAAKEYFIEIVGVRIEDLEVPHAIMEARNDNLKLQQQELNKTLEIEMNLRLAASSLVQRVREAINDVIVDQIIAGQVDKGYLLIKTFQEAAKHGQLNASFTPDFMRYIETNGKADASNQKSLEEARVMFDKLRSMSNDQMMNYFLGKE